VPYIIPIVGSAREDHVEGNENNDNDNNPDADEESVPMSTISHPEFRSAVQHSAETNHQCFGCLRSVVECRMIALKRGRMV
jgi:hypothetical protein